MTDKEYDCIYDHFQEWWESGGCDADGQEAFWKGYELCMALNGLTKYIKDVENES